MCGIALLVCEFAHITHVFTTKLSFCAINTNVYTILSLLFTNVFIN